MLTIAAGTFLQFNIEKKINPRRALFTKMTFKDNGRTDKTLWVRFGDILTDLNRRRVLKMTARSIGGSECLAIEAGRFSTRNRKETRTSLYVMKSHTK